MKKQICLALVLIMMCGMFAGCDDDVDVVAPQPHNVACVVTIANNNPRVDAKMIDELSVLPGLPGSTYAVINAEGQPRVIYEGEIPDFSERGYSKAMLERIQASVFADISNQIDTAQPCTPEVDLASATILAVRTIRANESEGQENLLVFYCSGISSAGLIDMTAVPVCELDIESSVGSLTASMDVDMKDIDVIMYCCGDVAGEDQPVLSSSEQSKLKSFYEQLFLKMGADSVTFMDDIPADGAYAFDHPVTVMRTEGTTSGLQATVINSNELVNEEILVDVFADGDILSFDEPSIKFQPDSTELVDPVAATESLSYVIDYMLVHPDFELLICGTTTSAGEESSCMAFSEKRASKVRDLLIEAGVDGSKIHILGCGYSSVLYIPDRNAYGLDESIAPQNRSVKLVAYDSDTASQIIDSLNSR